MAIGVKKPGIMGGSHPGGVKKVVSKRPEHKKRFFDINAK
jgi:hypothetical protein